MHLDGKPTDELDFLLIPDNSSSLQVFFLCNGDINHTKPQTSDNIPSQIFSFTRILKLKLA